MNNYYSIFNSTKEIMFSVELVRISVFRSACLLAIQKVMSGLL